MLSSTLKTLHRSLQHLWKETLKRCVMQLATGSMSRTRAALIPGFENVKNAALGAGALSFNISGSGPTVFSFTSNNEKQIGEAMVNAFSARGISSTYEIMTVENKGAEVIG